MESLARTVFSALYYDVMDSLTFWNNLRSHIYIPCLSLYRRFSTSFHLESPLALKAMVGRTQQQVDKNNTLARVTLFAQILMDLGLVGVGAILLSFAAALHAASLPSSAWEAVPCPIFLNAGFVLDRRGPANLGCCL